jgi:hypothetical protein
LPIFFDGMAMITWLSGTSMLQAQGLSSSSSSGSDFGVEADQTGVGGYTSASKWLTDRRRSKHYCGRLPHRKSASDTSTHRGGAESPSLEFPVAQAKPANSASCAPSQSFALPLPSTPAARDLSNSYRCSNRSSAVMALRSSSARPVAWLCAGRLHHPGRAS